MINVVIPMAGAGNRFQKEGYTVPKPFIKFKNKMMIEHVLNSFDSLNAKFILVLQEKFLEEEKEELEYIKKNYKTTFVTVPKLTMGAAITALASHKAINPNSDILFADSDNIFKKEDILNFIQDARKRNLSGSLLTVKSNNPCYSYAEIDKNGNLVKTKEKEVISENAIAGAYYFNKLENFKDATIDLIVESDISKGEFYMSCVYNHLKKFTKKIGIFNINSFICVGTPKQLEEYIKKENFVEI